MKERKSCKKFGKEKEERNNKKTYIEVLYIYYLYFYIYRNY